MRTKLPIEAYTTVFDYLKHISSLSTGSVLLLVTFLDKLFKDPEWKICIVISLISFSLAVVASIASQAGVIEMIDEEEGVANWARPLTSKTMIAVWTLFLVGLYSLVVFAIKNLY